MIKELTKEYIDQLYLLASDISDNFSKLYDESALIDGVNKTYIYLKNEELIGFIHVQNLIDEVDIINIYIKYEERKKGYASKLIDYIAKIYGEKKIILEVSVDNIPAIKLYEKYGFVEINRRKGYYSGTDAIVMEKKC